MKGILKFVNRAVVDNKNKNDKIPVYYWDFNYNFYRFLQGALWISVDGVSCGKFKSSQFISLKEIGDKENISSGYLEEIAAMLKRKFDNKP